MATLILAPALTRWLPHDELRGVELSLQLAGDSVAQVLERLFQQHAGLRGYILDEHGVVRHHVAVFVDGQSIEDKQDLRQPVSADAEIYVMQALSGG